MADNSLKTSELPQALNVASSDRILVLFNANNANALPSTRTITVANFVNIISTDDGGVNIITLYGSTVGSNTVVLTTNGNSASNSNQLILNTTQAVSFSGMVTGVIFGTSISAGSWKFSGSIWQNQYANTTNLTGVTPDGLGYTLQGNGTYIDISEYVINSDNTFSSSVVANTVTLFADTVNGGLSVAVTGFPSSNIMWQAQLYPNIINY